MTIAICDDTKNDLKQIRELCTAYYEKNEVQGDIKLFASGEALLKYGCETFDIIFMDVRMPGRDGIEIGREIRKCNEDVEIIFVSTYADYALSGYDVHAYHYLLKDQLKDSFETCFDGVVHKVQSKDKYMNLKLVGGHKVVPVADIIYVSSRGRRVTYHLIGDDTLNEGQRPHINQKLNNLEEEFSILGFIRISQSYLVNTRHIKTVQGSIVTLQNGVALDISRSRLKDVKRKFALLEGNF